jgi:hypothetical protein
MSGNGEPIPGAGGEPAVTKPGVDSVGSQPGNTDTLFGVDSSSWAGVSEAAQAPKAGEPSVVNSLDQAEQDAAAAARAEAGRPPLKPDVKGAMLNHIPWQNERFFTGGASLEALRARLMTRLEAELSQITRERAGLDLKGDVLRYAAEIGDSNLFEAVSSGSSVTDVLKAVVETKEPGVEPVAAGLPSADMERYYPASHLATEAPASLEPIPATATGIPSAEMERYYPASHIGTEPTTAAAPPLPAETPKGNPQ